MAEKDLLLTQSQELTLLMEQEVGTYMALLQNDSMGHEQSNDHQLIYSEEFSGLFKSEDDSQLLQNDRNDTQLLQQHVSQLLPQEVTQLYQTANNFSHQNNFNSQLMSYHSSALLNHPSSAHNVSPPNVNHLPVINYLPPINCLPQQINEVKMPPILSTEDYPGPYNFDVYFNPLNVRNPWLYSPALDKLFITMGDSFPVDFKRDGDAEDLYIRATTLYASPQLNQEIVMRCWAHIAADDPFNTDVPDHIISHVLRCQDSNSNYQGDVKMKQHLSVAVPFGLPPAGTDVFRLIYYFVCKNSCPTGINRRPTCVIFTLEDKFGAVKGRRRLNVRVCSCPKRDKEKEEKDAVNGTAPRGKKRKIEKIEKKESSEDAILDNKEEKFNVNFDVYGKKYKLMVLYAVHDRLCGELSRHGPNENLKKSIDAIEKQIKMHNQDAAITTQ